MRGLGWDTLRKYYVNHISKAIDYVAGNNQAIHMDCSGAARQVTLPPGAVLGKIVIVIDETGNSATNNITVARNGSTINGVSSNFVLDSNFGIVCFIGDGGDWILDLGGVDIIGGAGRTVDLVFVVDGLGSVITTGAKAWLRIPWGLTLTGWKITTDVSTTTTIDVWKDTYANFPPTNADTITNGHEPAISATVKAEDTDITDWTTVTVAMGDFVRINIDANDNATFLVLNITAERT